VVAFSSDRRLDPSLRSLPEKPRFFSSRPVLFPQNSESAAENLRARWWPGEMPAEGDEQKRDT
jgi:hypothetical protein